MYKNSIVLSEKTQISNALRMENMCSANGFYWFTSFYYNALFKMDKETWKSQFVCSFPGEVSKKRMYAKIIPHGMKLYGVPLSANSVGIYDMVTGESLSIQLEEPKRKGKIRYKEDSKFIDAAYDEEYLYLLPHTYPYLVRMRFSDGQMDYFYEPLVAMEQSDQAFSLQPDFYFGRFTQANGNRWVFSCVTGMVYRFIASDVIFEPCGYTQAHPMTVIVSETHFIWVFSVFESVIYKVDLETNEYIKISDFPEGFIPGSFSMTRGALYGDSVYFLPGTANKSIKVNTKTNQVSFAEEFSPKVEERVLDKEVWKFGFLKNLDEKLYAYDATEDQLIEYDAQGQSVRRQVVSIDFSDKNTERWMDDYLLLGEEHVHRVRNLDSFLGLILRGTSQMGNETEAQRRDKDNPSNEGIGKRIYERIIKK